MASPPVLAFDELLEPIPGDSPAGDSVPFTMRQELEEFRKEIDPNKFDEDDPRRPTEFKRADWPAIIALAQDILRNTSKDLLVAARLTEALTREHGFSGLRDGFHLLRLMVEQCWDRINPSIEDGDLEVRAGPFHWLDDVDKGARFPTTVRMVPLVFLEDQLISWYQWKQLQDGKGDVTAENFEQAVQKTPRDFCQLTMDDLDEAKAEINAVNEALSAYLGEMSPSLLELQRALADCEGLGREILKRKGPAPDEAPPEEHEEVAAASTGDAGEPAAAGAGRAPAPRRGPTREDIYRQLGEAATILQKMEPHSPIPYLLQKAVEWGALPFPQLIKALIRDENIITELNRELGIREPPPAE